MRFWENETPLRAAGNKTWLAYFPKAGKVVFGTLHEPKPKTFTLDIRELALHPDMLALLRDALNDADNYPVDTGGTPPHPLRGA